MEIYGDENDNRGIKYDDNLWKAFRLSLVVLVIY